MSWIPRNPGNQCHTSSRGTGPNGTRPRTTTAVASHATCHWQHDRQIQQCRLEEGHIDIEAATDEGRTICGLQHRGRSDLHPERRNLGPLFAHLPRYVRRLFQRDGTHGTHKEAKADREGWKDLKTKSKRRLAPQPGDHKPTLSTDWIKDTFNLSDNETLKDKPELLNQLIKVLASHGPAFEGGPQWAQEAGQVRAGRTHWITARVELRDDNRGPAHVKHGTLWQSVEFGPHSSVQERLLAETVLSGPETLNKQCKKLSVFQGSIDTNLDRLHGSILYSAFDMSSGFMAVRMEDSSKQFFAFTTPNQGTYALSVLPFSWVNSPAFYAKFVSRLVSTMPVGSTLAYVDDILLHSKDASGIHMVQLIDQFLTRVEQSGAKIQVPKTALIKTQVNYLGFIVGAAGITMNQQYRSALFYFPPPTTAKELARFLGMIGFYRHFLPGLATDSARLHTKKHENPWMPMSEEELEDFYKIKDKLINSEALASPDFSDIDKHPLIMVLNYSIKAMCVTISQVQKCLDGRSRWRLLFCSGIKCSPSRQNWLSHHGESATFVWGLSTYAWLLKQAPFLVETDSMSMKYIDTMKNSRGVHARWAELIGSYSFTITHVKVTMEDCFSRCPSHLPEPTQEELDMEKDWEPDPPPNLNLEKLATQSAKLQVRPERICHLEEEQICMNMMFGTNKVWVSWERTEVPENETSDWEEELNATINELHQDPDGLPVNWENSWEWTQSGEDYPRPCHGQDTMVYYSDLEAVRMATPTGKARNPETSGNWQTQDLLAYWTEWGGAGRWGNRHARCGTRRRRILRLTLKNYCPGWNGSSCRIPPLRQRRRKVVKLVKSVGEGDWGGEDDLEKPDVRSHPSYTDWLLDFVGAGPPIVSSGSDNDNATQWEQPDQGPQPGPSMRPTSARDLPAGLLPAREEAPSQTLTEPDISRARDSPASISGQPPTEPDLQSSSSVGSPKTQAKATVPRIQPHPTPQQSRELQCTSPHLRPRDLESEKEKPPSKVTKVSEMGWSHC